MYRALLKNLYLGDDNTNTRMCWSASYIGGVMFKVIFRYIVVDAIFLSISKKINICSENSSVE